MNKKLYTLFLLFLLKCSLAQTLYFPPTVGSTWDTLAPNRFGWCQARIDSIYNYLQAKNSKSFIVLKDGKIVLEKYFGTYTKDSLFYWASASKSLASFITGMAQKKGYININNKVSQYLGNGWTSAPLPKEDLIKVKDLLQMTAGLDDMPPAPCDHLDTAKACLQYLADAGTRWGYHTGAYRKVQDVVSAVVGQNYNIITNNWVETPTGMSGLWYDQIYYSKARDMARFGLLCLNKGIWAQDTLMKDSLYFKQMINTSQNLNLAYGYLWWLNGKASGMAPQLQLVFPGPLMSNAPADMYCALGKNDQKIFVVPSQKMVVIRQGNSAGGFSLASSAFDNTLWDYINKLNCNVAGIGELNVEEAVQVYPNPSKGIITLRPLTKFGAVNYSITDLAGRIVCEGTLSDQLTLQLQPGLYCLKIVAANQQIINKKLIIEP